MNKTEYYLIVFVVFLTTGAFISCNTIRTGDSSYVDGFAPQNEEISDEEDYELPVENAANVGNLSIMLKMPEECYTPDKQLGYCIEIKKCTLLLNQLSNTNASKFLKDSKCGTDNGDAANPNVCCGTGDLRNPPTNQFADTEASVTSLHNVDHNGVLPKECGHQKINMKGRIFGGEKASLGEFPWMARLLHKDKHGKKHFGCSGFLVHSKYVLTAGHCTHKKFIVKRGPVYSVVLGEHDIRTESDCEKGICSTLTIRKVADVVIHPDYDPDHETGNYNDITLIRLKSGAKISDFVKPICLNRVPSYTPTEYVLSGWGKTETEIVSSVKMKVSLPVVDRNECDIQYSIVNVTLRKTQICAGGEEGKDSCSGDSGGPLMYVDNNAWFAAGLVSFGIGCGTEGWPGVYTNIAHYVTWIQNTIFNEKTKSSQINTKTKREHLIIK